MASHEFKSNYHQFVKSSQEQFVQSSHDFSKAEAQNPICGNSKNCDNIPVYNDGSVNKTDKTWLEQAQTCLGNAISKDRVEMDTFGPEPLYLQTLKQILNTYDPNIQYGPNSKCSKEPEMCPNRRAFIHFLHRNAETKNALGRATYKENGLLVKQFDNWKIDKLGGVPISENTNTVVVGAVTNLKEAETKKLTPGSVFWSKKSGQRRVDSNGGLTMCCRKPDFFDPVPPYPIKPDITPNGENDEANPPMGWTDGGSTLFTDETSLFQLELAHIVDSGKLQWVQYLVNRTPEDNFLTFNFTGNETQYQKTLFIKQKLKELHEQQEDIIFKTTDGRPEYFTGEFISTTEKHSYHTKTGWETRSMSDMTDVELGPNDSAGNILAINKRAHHLLFDKWMKTSGSPNMSNDKKHDFFTVDATGGVHGISTNMEINSNTGIRDEFCGSVSFDVMIENAWDKTEKRRLQEKQKEYERTGSQDKMPYLECGVGPNSRINKYWYDCSDEMWHKEPVQWLQNYRRKRWTQIRNIIYAFMLEAAPNVNKNNKKLYFPYKDEVGTQPHFTQQYHEEYQRYLKTKGLESKHVETEDNRIKEISKALTGLGFTQNVPLDIGGTKGKTYKHETAEIEVTEWREWENPTIKLKPNNSWLQTPGTWKEVVHVTVHESDDDSFKEYNPDNTLIVNNGRVERAFIGQYTIGTSEEGELTIVDNEGEPLNIEEYFYNGAWRFGYYDPGVIIPGLFDSEFFERGSSFETVVGDYKTNTHQKTPIAIKDGDLFMSKYFPGEDNREVRIFRKLSKKASAKKKEKASTVVPRKGGRVRKQAKPKTFEDIGLR